MHIALLLCAVVFVAEACEPGLTQLRQRDTLRLITCKPGTPDECVQLTGSTDARCSVDVPDTSYICCGPTELLIQLLSGEIQPVEDASLSRTIRPFPIPFNLVLTTSAFPSAFNPPSTVPGNSYISVTSAPTTMPQVRIFPPLPMPMLTTASRVVALPPNMQPFTTLGPNGANVIQSSSSPTISLIATGDFRTNGNSSWQAASTVVLVQDGPCTIIVNTGLPVQKNEVLAGMQDANIKFIISFIIFGLAARGIGQKGVDYTVVTSGHPQFVGNLNLFPTSRLLMGWLMASWRNVEQSALFEEDSMLLCSQNSQLVKAPGPTADSGVVVVYGVDGMGSVAITGDLFMYDDNLSRLDSAFVWDDVMMQQSRRRVVCLADWLVPGHGVPLPISRATKQQAGCS